MLYDKIYEAVDTAIQKALIITDDQSQDVSTKFVHKEISADSKVLNHYVYNLLNTNETEYYYEQIMAHYNETGNRYTVNTWDELVNIYNKMESLQNYENEWVNLIKLGIFCICKDSTETHIENIKDTSAVIFLKIVKDGYTIIMHKDLLIEDMQWIRTNASVRKTSKFECVNGLRFGSYNKAKEFALNDFNGYDNTYKIIDDNKISDFPAIEYCINKGDEFPGFAGYLPAAGELNFLFMYQIIINDILQKINGNKSGIQNNKDLFNLSCDNYSSSTEYSDVYIWFLRYQSISHEGYKSSSHNILPLFKEKDV